MQSSWNCFKHILMHTILRKSWSCRNFENIDSSCSSQITYYCWFSFLCSKFKPACWYHQTFGQPFLDSNLYLDDQRVCHVSLWDIFLHTDTLITFSSYPLYLDSFSSSLGHLTFPLMTPDLVTSKPLLIPSESVLVIHTSWYLLSTL